MNQRRQPGRKAADFRLAWRNQAADTSFGGKSLADLEAALAAVAVAQERKNELQIEGAAAAKNLADLKEDLRSLLRMVTRGVQADPAHGEDSALYRSMGFVPISDRASGLSRRKAPAGNEQTAA